MLLLLLHYSYCLSVFKLQHLSLSRLLSFGILLAEGGSYVLRFGLIVIGILSHLFNVIGERLRFCFRFSAQFSPVLLCELGLYSFYPPLSPMTTKRLYVGGETEIGLEHASCPVREWDGLELVSITVASLPLSS